jgi:hypothetical protein
MSVLLERNHDRTMHATAPRTRAELRRVVFVRRRDRLARSDDFRDDLERDF